MGSTSVKKGLWGGVLILFLSISLLFGKEYKLFFGYQKGGVIVTKIEYSTFLKTTLKAYKGRIDQNFMEKEKMEITDQIEEVRQGRIQQIKRKYEKYQKITQPWGEDRPIKSIHFLTGTEWRLVRQNRRNKVTLLVGSVPQPAVRVVRMDDPAEILSYTLRRKGSLRPGDSWELSREEAKLLMGDNWQQGSRCVVRCTFERKVFFKGYRCAKVRIYQQIKGKHKIGLDATMELKGYLYYSLEYGFPVYLELRGKMVAQVKQIAPRGQVAEFYGEGPVKVLVQKEYLPPDAEGDTEEDTEGD